MLAGLLVGASLTLGLLGLYVFSHTLEADDAVGQATANAAAVVDAENQRKRREADNQL